MLSRPVTREDFAAFSAKHCSSKCCHGSGFVNVNVGGRSIERQCKRATDAFEKEHKGRLASVNDILWWRAGLDPENHQATLGFLASIEARRAMFRAERWLRDWAENVNEAAVLAELSAEVERARAAA